MGKLRRFWLAMTLVTASFAASAALYGRLPASIPTHWDAQGVIDGWMPKSQGAFIAPCGALVILIVLILTEPLQTRDDADGQKARYFPTLVAAVSAILLYGNVLLLMAGVGWHLDIPSHLAVALGLLIVVLGNSLGRVPQNSGGAVHAPWTVTDEEVWGRTQRIAGWLTALAGIVTAVTGFMGLGLFPGLIAISATALVSVGYSYKVWQRLNRRA